MKVSKIIRGLELVKEAVNFYEEPFDDFTSPEGTEKRKKKIKKAINAAIEALEENKKLRKKIKKLERKISSLEYFNEINDKFIMVE